MFADPFSFVISCYIISYNFLLVLQSSAYLHNSDIGGEHLLNLKVLLGLYDQVEDKCKIYFAKCSNM